MLADNLRQQFAWASQDVPDLAKFAPAVESRADAVAQYGRLPQRQRIHGDLHLGQVLLSDGHWVIIDFEGEPLKPLEERIQPDLALRDVAGVLCSFDYAADDGKLRGEAAEKWTRKCRGAFLHNYCAATNQKLTDIVDVLRFYELSKTLYEMVYEAGAGRDKDRVPLSRLERLIAA